jgi:very-short-patch-repair endonuclease
VHETGTLHVDDIACVDGIPCTSVARALLDYAQDASRHRLGRAVEESQRLGLFDGQVVEDVLARANGRRVAALRNALRAWGEPQFTRSEAEQRLRALIEDAGLPLPGFNAWVEGCEVDAYWPRHRLVVEVDGFEYHRTRAAFERDRLRDAELGDAGLRVIRTTWRQLRERESLAARLSRALSTAST